MITAVKHRMYSVCTLLKQADVQPLLLSPPYGISVASLFAWPARLMRPGRMSAPERKSSGV